MSDHRAWGNRPACPACHVPISSTIDNPDLLVCPLCEKKYHLASDGSVIEGGSGEVPEPLWLPKGSIRALVTLSLAFSTWFMVLVKQEPPAYVYSLLLTMIAYYFAFRKGEKERRGAVMSTADLQDALRYTGVAKPDEKDEDCFIDSRPGASPPPSLPPAPLFLPAGVIRSVLIAGFGACGFMLYARGEMDGLKNLEFFGILAGLIAGYIFAKVFTRNREAPFTIFVNHVKGGFMVCAGMSLAMMLLVGMHAEHATTALGLACCVSFYFGSKS